MDEIRLGREELYQKVWDRPTTVIAAELGISDVALAKICRKLNVPKPPRGYWRQLAIGLTPKQPPLPKAAPKNTIARFHNHEKTFQHFSRH